MTLSQHAKNRMIQRNKQASYMRMVELQALIDNAVKFKKHVSKDHGFKAEYYLIESMALVLVVNPANKVIVTVYNKEGL